MPKPSHRDAAFQEFYSHFPKSIGEGISAYVTNNVLVRSRYIFTRRQGPFQFGFCTHCKKEYMTEEYLKPAQKAMCKLCQSECVVKASGMSRKHLVDSAYIVYYEKSLVNPKAIVARGIYVERDYRGDYYRVETHYRPENLYLFEPGNSRMYFNSCYGGGWVSGSKIRSAFSEYPYQFNKKCSFESIEAAVKGTPYQYSTWEQYSRNYSDPDMVKFFDLYSKSPCVEFLTKAGMQYFVSAKLCGNATYGAINWKGIKAQEVLKLDGQRIREIRMFKGELHPLTLRLQQIVAKDNSKLSLGDLQSIAKEYGHCFEDIKKALKYTTLRRAIAYITKQRRIERENGRESISTAITRTWRDYIADCKQLDLDLKNDRILFPSKLYEAHQFTLKQVKDRADELLKAKINKRFENLSKKYNFEQDGLFIRPAFDANELIQEGKKLDHCVGRYANDYANGRTDLLFVRRTVDPGKPFYTMEVQKDKVVQCRGLKNCSMTPEVKAFVDLFISKKLIAKERTRIDVTGIQPAVREGVAI